LTFIEEAVYFTINLSLGESIPMIRHKSTEKRARQNKKQYHQNRAIKSSMKTGIKNLLAVLEAKNGEEGVLLLKKVTSTISKAASKGVIHSKTASRRISRLTKRANKVSAV
jgi:small subunit ribosomal protein S20